MRTRPRLVLGAAVALVLLVVYGAISWIFSDKLIGGQWAPDEQVQFADFGLPDPEAVTIANGRVQLAAWYFANPRRAGCAVVMLHGYRINKATALTWTPLFWERGCDLFLYDLRSHGASSAALLSY